MFCDVEDMLPRVGTTKGYEHWRCCI